MLGEKCRNALATYIKFHCHIKIGIPNYVTKAGYSLTPADLVVLIPGGNRSIDSEIQLINVGFAVSLIFYFQSTNQISCFVMAGFQE